MEKNSGAPGIPNNRGLNFSRGEYIFFLDNDDAIIETALEELYPIAKKFDADVVYCDRYFYFNDGETNITLTGLFNEKEITEPTLITEDLTERVKDLYAVKFLWPVWTKLIRRDMITENGLLMVDANAHDAIYTDCLFCCAKRCVRVPKAVNIYRVVKDSLSHKKDNLPKTVKKWLNSLTKGFNYFDKFLSERKFFMDHPDVKHLALEIWVRECCNYLLKHYAEVPVHVLNELVYREFSAVEEKNALMSFIFSRMNIFHVNLNRQAAMIQQMNAHIQKQNELIQNLQEQVRQ